uniref:HDC12867 n=1 Tax=Drosophila melanogaster TaxID=7227 RepID=Q6IKD0_DROME|nr:TPA_inf: HDC12867 [Drosophila melanogaster]
MNGMGLTFGGFVLHVAAATFLQQLRQLQQQLRHEQQHSFVARWGSKISCLCKLFVDNFVCYKSPHATRPDRGLYAKDSQPSNREENRRPWSDVAKTKALKRTPPARTRSAFWPWPIAALMTPLLSAQVPKCCLSSSIPCQSSATFQAHANTIILEAGFRLRLPFLSPMKSLARLKEDSSRSSADSKSKSNSRLRRWQ